MKISQQTVDLANTAIAFEAKTGIDVTKHDSLDSIAAAFLKCRSVDTLQALIDGEIPGINDKRMGELARIELESRK